MFSPQPPQLPTAIPSAVNSHRFHTNGGVVVTRHEFKVGCSEQGLRSNAGQTKAGEVMDFVTSALDTRRGCINVSDYTYPGRYHRWALAFVDPPMVLESKCGGEVLSRAHVAAA